MARVAAVHACCWALRLGACGWAPATAPTSCGPSTGDVYVGGLFDYRVADRHHFSFAAELINNKSDGFRDELLPDVTLRVETRDSGCDAVRATSAAWDLAHDWGQPLHGVIGARCSSASMGVATLARLQQVVQISARSTSPALSDTEAYSHFFRTCAPDNRQGPALRALVAAYGWSRVGIIQTDLSYPIGLAHEFADGWSGTVAEWCTVPQDGSAIETGALDDCFRSIDALPPPERPRVILLSAHSEPATQILEHAEAAGWQPNTVWVSTDGWTGMARSSGVASYQLLGIRPAQNLAAVEYHDYLERWRTAQQEAGEPPDEVLCKYCAETVDAVVALAAALTAAYAAGATPGNSLANIENGTVVTQHLREVSFNGVSGSIAFDEHGDRLSQAWEVLHAEPTVMEVEVGWASSEVFVVSPSSQSAWPHGPMGAPADSYADRNGGSADCPCIDATAVVGSNRSAACMSFVQESGFNIDHHCYPPTYGSDICAPHDSGLGPHCTSSVANPAFCGELWCYVDKEKCKGSTHSLRRSDLHAQGSEEGDGLYFSYSTCGGASSAWDDFQTTSILTGKTLRGIVPLLDYPTHYKRDAAGNVPTATYAAEYYNDSVAWAGAVPEYLSAVVALSNIQGINCTWRSRGAPLNNGAWTASVHDVKNGISDFGASNFWATSDRLKMTPFTVPLYVDEVYLWIENPAIDESLATKMWTVASPFAGTLWLSLGLATFVVAMLNIWYALPGEDFERWHLGASPPAYLSY